MTGYLINFSIYTMAMIGVIFIALFVFKNFSGNGAFSKKSTFLNIEDSLNLSARKTLFVIKAGEQRFLVASDIDRTSLISKLNEENPHPSLPLRKERGFDLPDLSEINDTSDFSSVIDFQRATSGKKPMMKELAEKLKNI